MLVKLMIRSFLLALASGLGGAVARKTIYTGKRKYSHRDRITYPKKIKAACPECGVISELPGELHERLGKPRRGNQSSFPRSKDNEGFRSPMGRRGQSGEWDKLRGQTPEEGQL